MLHDSQVWSFSVGILPVAMIFKERNLCVWWGFSRMCGLLQGNRCVCYAVWRMIWRHVILVQELSPPAFCLADVLASRKMMPLDL